MIYPASIDEITPEFLHSLFTCDPIEGTITNRATGYVLGSGVKRSPHIRGRPSYKTIRVGATSIAIHRVVWMMHYNEKPEKGMVIDHIDNDPHNNRVSNLQLLTQSENAAKDPHTRAIQKAVKAMKMTLTVEAFNYPAPCPTYRVVL